MKLKFYFAATLLLCFGSLFAQPKTAENPKLFIKSPYSMMAPVWSPDGSKIAISGENYVGIWVANADGSNLIQITTDKGAGYKMVWSADSKQILSRPDQVIDNKKYYDIKTYDATTGKSQTLVSKSRDIKGSPIWKDSNEIQFSDKTGTARIKKGTISKTSASNIYEIMVQDPANATSQIAALSQFKGIILMNPALSPDKSKIAFQILGKGLWICDANGSNLKSLGKGSRPAWLPDNKTIIVARTSDNGQTLTASDLYAIDCNNGNSTNLTENTSIVAFAPAVSPDGKKVAVENCADGNIYIMDLKY